MAKQITESHIHIASKLLECRDTCRKFYGSRWQAKQEEWKPIIEAVMKKENCEVLQVAIIIGKQIQGFSLMTCLGVITEMMEEEKDNG